MKKEKVLLTGISGFIGLHCAQQLLNQGFEVRGSVRNAAQEKEVRATLSTASVNTTNLSIVDLDLTPDKGWDDAANGCDYLMHLASPFMITNPATDDAMIIPAIEGTIRALNAAQKAGIKRVVLPSSILAMSGSMKTGTLALKIGPIPTQPTSALTPKAKPWQKSCLGLYCQSRWRISVRDGQHQPRSRV